MTIETTPTEPVVEGDSAVIKAMRLQIKDLESDLKSRPDAETVRKDMLAEQARDLAIGEQLIALGQPEGLSAVLADRVEGEVTLENVSSVLEGLGFETEPVEGSQSKEGTEESALAKVASLSSAVSSAASNQPADTVETKIAEAETDAELDAVMSEADLIGQYH